MRSLTTLLLLVVGCGMAGACASSDGENRPAKAVYLIGASKTDRLVADRLRRAVSGSRTAQPPIQVDMRRIAPFAWTRMYVFSFEDRGAIQQRIEKHSGFHWAEAPKQAAIEARGTSVLVFTSQRRVLSVVRDGDVAFDCLDTEEGGMREESRFVVLRTAGDPVGVPPDVKPTPPEPVALPALDGSRGSEPCIESLGVLH